MTLGYCPKCRKNIGDRFCTDEGGIWRCSKCKTKLHPPLDDPKTCLGCKRVFKGSHSLGLHFWQNKRRNIDCSTGKPPKEKTHVRNRRRPPSRHRRDAR